MISDIFRYNTYIGYIITSPEMQAQPADDLLESIKRRAHRFVDVTETDQQYRQ